MGGTVGRLKGIREGEICVGFFLLWFFLVVHGRISGRVKTSAGWRWGGSCAPAEVALHQPYQGGLRAQAPAAAEASSVVEADILPA